MLVGYACFVVNTEGLLFVGVLALCFFLTAFTIQDPPPGEQFVAVGFADLGSTEEAAGNVESETPSEVVQEAEEEAVAASEPEPVVEEAAEAKAASHSGGNSSIHRTIQKLWRGVKT